MTQAANDFGAACALAVGVGTGTVTASFDTATASTRSAASVAAPSVGTYRLVPTGSQPRGHLDAAAAVTLPTTAISGGGDYTLLVSDGPTAGTAIATLLADDNAPLHQHHQAGEDCAWSTASTRPSSDALTVRQRLHRRCPRRQPSAYVLRGDRLDRDQGRDHRSAAQLCTGLATLSATPTVYSVFALGSAGRQPRRAAASFAPTADRSSSGASVLAAVHCLSSRKPRRYLQSRLRRSNRPADPVPVITGSATCRP